jgi:hypothetical protein
MGRSADVFSDRCDGLLTATHAPFLGRRWPRISAALADGTLERDALQVHEVMGKASRGWSTAARDWPRNTQDSAAVRERTAKLLRVIRIERHACVSLQSMGPAF